MTDDGEPDVPQGKADWRNYAMRTQRSLKASVLYSDLSGFDVEDYRYLPTGIMRSN